MERIIDKINFPKDWKPFTVNELGKVFKGKGVSKSEILDSGLPCVRYGEIYTQYHYKFDKTHSFINDESAKNSQEIKFGDVLFSGSGETAEEIGKAVCYIGNNEAYAGGDIVIFRPKEPKSGLFFGYLMNSDYVVQQKFQEGQGHSVVHIYGKSVERIKVVLPPLPEQQKIAAILSKWDELIDTQTQLINTKEKQKTSLMQKLLTGKVRFPGFEDEWEEYTIGEHLTFQNGYAFKSKLFNDKNKGLRLVKNRDLKNDNLVIFTTETFKPEYLIANGDLLVGMDGDFSPCIWKKGESLLNQRVGRLINFSDKVNKEFLYYFLTDILTKIQNDTGSTTVKHLSGSDITELNVIIPNLKEQEKIANTLIACDEELQSLKDEFDSIKLQKKGLMQQLLTGKIRVKI